LHNIYFATGKTRILDSSEGALNELYRFLQSRPNQRIRIVGHTDNIGSDRANQALSEGRCHEVRQACLYVSHLRGGYGCGRDVIEQTLRAQGKWVMNERAFGW
jgi:flagellar motor protein MotB